MTNRLFISADISKEIKEKIIEVQEKVYGTDINIQWENKNKLHVTLKFLGDVDESKTQSIILELENILRNYKSINCSFTKFGLFKKNNIPSILWLGINYNKDLDTIAHTINNNFEKHGFDKEKRNFKPHLTLLRLKGKEDINRIKKFLDYELPEIKFTINEISLMKSKLLKSGSIYKQIKSFKLN